MIQHCPVLIVLLPLTAALLCLLFSKFNKNLGSWLSSARSPVRWPARCRYCIKL